MAHAQVLAWANLSQGSDGIPRQAMINEAGYRGQQVVAIDQAGSTFAIAVAQQPFTYANEKDYYVQKVDASGQLVWRRRVESLNEARDIPNAISVDAQGDVVVTGTSDNTYGGEEVFTVKLRGNTGATIWQSRIIGEEWDRTTSGREVVVSPAGDVFVAALSYDWLNDVKLLVFKLDGASGVVVWRALYERIPGTRLHWDYVEALVLDDAGNLLVACHTGSALSGADASVLKFDGATGAVVWESHFQGTNGGASREYVVDLALGESGRIFLLGGAESAPGEVDYLTIAISGVDGTEIWRSVYDGGFVESPSDLVVSSGRVFVTGWSENSAGDRDFATVAYDAEDGDELWASRHDEPNQHSNDEALSIVAGGAESVLVSGRSSAAATGLDILTVGYSIDAGTEQWVRKHQLPGGTNDDVMLSMGADATGDPRVVGFVGQGADRWLSVLRYRVSNGDLLWSSGEGGMTPEPEALACPWDSQLTEKLIVDSQSAVVVAACAEEAGRQRWTVTKRNSNGQVVWRKQDDQAFPNWERVAAIAGDDAGNILLFGNAMSEDNVQSILTIKLSGADGTELWRRSVPSVAGATEFAKAILAAADGDALVAMDVCWSNGECNVRLARYDSGSGSTIWAAELSDANGFAEYDSIAAFILNEAGDIVVVPNSLDGYDPRVMASRLDGNSGQVRWSQNYASPMGQSDISIDAALDQDGNVFVAATSWAPGESKILIVKFDSGTGNVVWGRRGLTSNPADAYAADIEVDPDGNPVVIGTIADQTAPYRMFTARISGSNGSTLWSALVSGSGSWSASEGRKLALSDGGDVYAIGIAVKGAREWAPIVQKYQGSNGSPGWLFEHHVGAGSWLAYQALATSDGALIVASDARTDLGRRVGLIKLLDRPPPHPNTLFADSFD